MRRGFRWIQILMVLLLAVSLSQLGCGGGDSGGNSNFTPSGGGNNNVTTTTISGLVSAPNGSLRSARSVIVGNGCFGVPNAPVSLRQITTLGPTYSDPIASTTTDNDGFFTLELPAGFEFSADLVLSVDGSTVSLHAFLTGTSDQDVNQATEAAVQLLCQNLEIQGQDFSQVSLDQEAELQVSVETSCQDFDYTDDDLASSVDVSIEIAINDDNVTAQLSAISGNPPGLEGTFSGSYSDTFVGDCTFTRNGTMTIEFNGNSGGDLGTVSCDGIDFLSLDTCSLEHKTTGSGTVSGISSTSQVQFTMSITIPEGDVLQFEGSGTLTGDTLAGTFTGNTSGSFTLIRE